MWPNLNRLFSVRLLSQSNEEVNIVVFEAESRLIVRSQGGTLDLLTKTGQAALTAAGLFDEFKKHPRYDGEVMKLAGKNLPCYVKMNGAAKRSTTGGPEIDRPVLRQVLYDSLPESIVQFKKKVLRVEQNEIALNLQFMGGTTAIGFNLTRQQLTFDMMELMFLVSGAPRTCIERYIIRPVGFEMDWILTKLFTPLVYLWFAVFKMIYRS